MEPAAVRLHGDMFVFFTGSEWTSYPQGSVRQPTAAPMHGGTLVFLRTTDGFHSRGVSSDSQPLCVWNLNSGIGPWLEACLEAYPEAYPKVANLVLWKVWRFGVCCCEMKYKKFPLI